MAIVASDKLDRSHRRPEPRRQHDAVGDRQRSRTAPRADGAGCPHRGLRRSRQHGEHDREAAPLRKFLPLRLLPPSDSSSRCSADSDSAHTTRHQHQAGRILLRGRRPSPPRGPSCVNTSDSAKPVGRKLHQPHADADAAADEPRERRRKIGWLSTIASDAKARRPRRQPPSRPGTPADCEAPPAGRQRLAPDGLHRARKRNRPTARARRSRLNSATSCSSAQRAGRVSVGSRAPSQVLHVLRQLFSRAMERALHRAHRQSGDLRQSRRSRARVRIAASRPRDTPASAARWPSAARTASSPRSAMARRRGGRRIGELARPRPSSVVSSSGSRDQRALPQLIDRDVVRNRQEPCRKFPLHVVGVQRAERLDERVLRKLLGARRVPDHPHDQADRSAAGTAATISRNADSAPSSAPRTSSTSVAGTLSVSLRKNGDSGCKKTTANPGPGCSV